MIIQIVALVLDFALAALLTPRIDVFCPKSYNTFIIVFDFTMLGV